LTTTHTRPGIPPPHTTQPHTQFTRSTVKYWVRPAHVVRVKAALCRQLPLLVYGAQSPVHQVSVCDDVLCWLAGRSGV